MPGGPVVDNGRIDFLDHPAFHFHIDLKVNMCGIDVCMSQPITDHVDVIPGAQQMHRSGMTKGMWGNGFGLDRRALVCGNGRIFANDVADSKARDRCTIGIQEQDLVCRLSGVPMTLNYVQ
jgi:hypothetical protein